MDSVLDIRKRALYNGRNQKLHDIRKYVYGLVYELFR